MLPSLLNCGQMDVAVIDGMYMIMCKSEAAANVVVAFGMICEVVVEVSNFQDPTLPLTVPVTLRLVIVAVEEANKFPTFRVPMVEVGADNAPRNVNDCVRSKNSCESFPEVFVTGMIVVAL